MATVIIAGVLGLFFWFWWGYEPKGQLDPEAQVQPDKKYTVVFWDFDRPLPGGASYREELVREIELFNQKFPNITVELKLFPWTQGEQVAAAIRRHQEVPHILSLGPLEGLDFARGLLLPASYLPEETRLDFVPLALSGPESEHKTAVWPRFLAPQLYLANTDLLQAVGVTRSGLQEQGIDWADILHLGRELIQLEGQPHALAGLDYQGLLVALAPREPDSLGPEQFSWPRSAADTALARLRQLQADNCLPPNIDQADYGGVKEFFTGQAALLAPAEPWLLRTVRARQEQIKHGLLPATDRGLGEVALIPPKLTPLAGLPARVEGLVVFRWRLAADEIKAAVEWAQHLSRSGTLPAKLDLLPAYRPSQDAWSVAWELGNEAVLLGVCEQGRRLAPYPKTRLEGIDS